MGPPSGIHQSPVDHPLPERSSPGMVTRLLARGWSPHSWPGACARLVGMDDCLACQLSDGRRPLPGGLIDESAGWRVEHRAGPLGAATLIVKPVRHVTAVADLSDSESSALGPMLQLASKVTGELVGGERVYNCLTS
jgi:hypothetical protein